MMLIHFVLILTQLDMVNMQLHLGMQYMFQVHMLDMMLNLV